MLFEPKYDAPEHHRNYRDDPGDPEPEERGHYDGSMHGPGVFGLERAHLGPDATDDDVAHMERFLRDRGHRHMDEASDDDWNEGLESVVLNKNSAGNATSG
jgi:hypothetical protein